MVSGKRLRTLFVWAIPILLVVGLAMWGWYDAGYQPGDQIYRAFQAFVLGDAYSALHETVGANGQSLTTLTKWKLEAARVIGAGVAFYAVFALLWSGFETLRLHWAARTRRDHLLVIGALPFADRLTEAAAGPFKTDCTQLRAAEDTALRRGRLIRLPFSGFDHDGVDEAGAARARKLIVATDDDAQTVDLALSAQRRYTHLQIMARVNDIWLLRSLQDLPGGEKLRAFSEAGAAAREIIRRHPPFLLAQAAGHSRIHALVVGDDDWVEAIMAELILSAWTLTFGKPAFTLVVADVADFQARLDIRYPEMAQTADLDIVAAAINDHASVRGILTRASGLGPVTAAYCAFDVGARSLTAGLALREEAIKSAGFKAPVFVRTSGDTGLIRPAGGGPLQDLHVVSFGSMSDIIKAAGIVSEKADLAERAWHDAYRRLNPEGDAAVPWEDLEEQYRISNRRAVAHTYAKLFEAGFNLQPWLAGANTWDELPALAPGEKLYRNEAELMRLAELEHERWNADRRMLGWRSGTEETHDKVRRVHRYLKPFSELTHEIQAYDITLIQHLDKILPRHRNGLGRR